MLTLHRTLALPALLIAISLLAGCASKRIVSQWSNLAYSSPSFKRIIVIGVSEQTSIRRNFEDEFVAQLRGTGLNAVPSYRFIPENGKAPEERLKRALREGGADAAIITRLVRVAERTRVSPATTIRFLRFLSTVGTPTRGSAITNCRMSTTMTYTSRKPRSMILLRMR